MSLDDYSPRNPTPLPPHVELTPAAIRAWYERPPAVARSHAENLRDLWALSGVHDAFTAHWRTRGGLR